MNGPFNNNIAILESKMIIFCLRPNFFFTLRNYSTLAPPPPQKWLFLRMFLEVPNINIDIKLVEFIE